MESTIQSYRKHAADTSGGISNLTIYNLFLDVIKKYSLNGEVADFGAGIGALTKKLHETSRFTAITSIDIMPVPSGIPDSIQWLEQDLNYPVECASQSFDVIVSSEVIEHLENPREVAREWYRLLKNNGTLVFSTPNNESWRSIVALIFRGHYAAFGDDSYPAHITALLRKDIQRMLKESGFQFDEFYYTDRGGIPKFPNIIWQKISFGLLKGLRYSDNILVVAKKLS